VKSKQIIAIATPDAALSKAQKEFNRLSKSVAQLRKSIEDVEEGTKNLQQKALKELLPLSNEYDFQRANLVRLFDRNMRSSGFKSDEKKKMKHLICELAGELAGKDVEEMKVIFDRYSKEAFDEMEAESSKQIIADMKDMFEELYGIRFDDEADISTPEKMREYVGQKMKEREVAETERQRIRNEKKKQGPKSAKQAAAEAKRAAKQLKIEEEQKKVSKSVREVYLDLVKTFHPDKELDETEQKRKTEIMQRVTAAYEANDLLALLSLQLEFERISTADLNALADERIRLFNSTLQRQLFELQQHLNECLGALSMLVNSNSIFGVSSVLQAEWALKDHIKMLKSAIKDIKKDINQLDDPAVLRAWLKDYRIPRSTVYDNGYC
jgi:hypothetical protein